MRRKKQKQKWIFRGAILAGGLAILLILTGYLRKEKATRQQDSAVRTVEVLEAPVGKAVDAEALQEMELYSAEQKLKYLEEHASEYPKKLLELLEKNPELLDYVFFYPMRGSIREEFDLAQCLEETSVPKLYQWDLRWGYEPYAGGMIGYAGCGPTSLSMVALAVTRNAEYTPAYVARMAEREGYSVKGTGTSWELMGKGCEAFGLQATELPLDENRMMSELANGHPIICAMGKGDFTESGHFIVIRGYLSGFLVNDPNSSVRSDRVWSFEELRPQIRNLWAYQ